MPSKSRGKKNCQRILVYAEKNNEGVHLARALQSTAYSLRLELVIATDLSTLQQALVRSPFSAVVIEVGRKSADAMAALRILEASPAVPVFIFNAFLLPRIEEKAREYGHYYFDKHDRLDEFMSLILAVLQRGKKGIIQGISLANFLQLMQLEKWSGQVAVQAAAKKGTLFLQDGQLTGVAMDPRTDAWREMADWKDITVEIFAAESRPIASGIRAESMPVIMKNSRRRQASSQKNPSGTGSIRTLQLQRQNRKIALDVSKLNLAVEEIRDFFPGMLLRTDVFLSDDGLSLAGWNSHPLACSQFASITRTLKAALHGSGFPALGDYYLLDLADDHLLFVIVRDQLQWGLLLQGINERRGLLLHVILPKAQTALREAVIYDRAV